jgi:hypothetical protein
MIYSPVLPDTDVPYTSPIQSSFTDKFCIHDLAVMASSIRLVSFLGAIALYAGLSTSAATPNATIDLFVAELAGRSTTNIEASIITVIPSLSETQMVISCPDTEESTVALHAPPCNLIHGATVTMNPTGMTLNLHRESIQTNTMGLLDDDTTWETALTE